MKKVLSLIIAVLMVLAPSVSFDNGVTAHAAAADITSGDGYVTFDSATKTWSMGTSKVEKKVQLNASGQFKLTSFKNKLSNREYVQGANQNSDEFSVQVNGTEYVGLSGGWVYDTFDTSLLSQNEIQLVITFHNNVLQVKRYYIIYPDTGVIQEWSEFKNTLASSANYSFPSIFRQRIMQNDVANVDFYYMTGGGHFTGSQVMKSQALSSSYQRAFNSYDTPELMTVDGHNENRLADNAEGAAVWNEFYALRNRYTSDGMFLTFDYMGHWGSNIGNWGGNVLLGASVHVDNQGVPSNQTITSPKSMTGVFSGDVDDMGNTILDYVYRYKWDYTRDDYFAQVKVFQWITGNQNANAFELLNNMRYLGADVIHIDDSWYDNKGDWNNYSGDDFAKINEYAKKQGMKMTVWMPPWHVNMDNQVMTEHPNWQVGADTYTYAFHLNGAIQEAVNWELNLLNSKQNSWGSYMWRYDGNMVWPSNGSDNVMLAQSSNWYELLKRFKDANPNAGIYGCSSGGHSITIESARYSDTQQTSDGNVYHFDGYWNSMITPPDKLTSGLAPVSWGTTYTPGNRGNLAMSWQIPMNSATAAMATASKESLRKDVEMYHFLKAQGVVGRWVKVYRPNVSSGTDKTYFLQKMNSNNTKGYITIRDYPAKIGQTVTVYPKGLDAAQNYTVSFINSTNQYTNTGSYWMTNGITMAPMTAGEMILLNLSNRPGMGSDTTAPTAPTNVNKLKSSYISMGGVELNWTAATDNNWISYYEIFKNGVSVDKVSKGTFYFTAKGKITDTFEVRTIDGDGNASAKVAAIDNTPAADPNKFFAFSDFSSTQGQRNWSYQQLSGGVYSNMTWDSTYARWKGTPTYAIVAENWQHPDLSYDSVRKWVAPSTGKVNISGLVRKAADSSGGNGVVVTIKKSTGTTLWGPKTISGTDIKGIPHNVETNVTAGDPIYFIVSCNGDSISDTTEWSPTISYTNTWTASADFSSTQYLNLWFYQGFNGSTYSNSAWDSTNKRWYCGPGGYAIVAKNWQHPDDNMDSVRNWTANKSATITIKGTARKSFSATAGDGVTLTIKKNGTTIWGPTDLAANNTTGVTHNFTTSVVSGDIIRFVVSKKGTKDYDMTYWDPTISY